MKTHSSSGVRYYLALLILVIPAIIGASSAAANAQADDGKIDSFVFEQLASDGQANVFVKMASDANLDDAASIQNRNERLNAVHEVLTAHATRTQQAIRLFLRRRGVQFRPFWINNSLYVYGADEPLVQALAQRSDVAYIRGDREVPMHTPVAEAPAQSETDAVEWNIELVQAPAVWALGYTGQGVVLANIDTGVRYTHEALVSSYRGNSGDGTFSHDYNWYDPAMDLLAPADNVGHGSHTMGIMVGGDGPGPSTDDIGVAPDAQWIAAKGCGTLFCSEFRLIASAEWVLCPTRVDGSDPDCSKAPDIVNNSWGGAGGDNWYLSYIRAWLAAGIAPVFSVGNSGPDCGTAGSPGDYNLVAGVGATDADDVLADYSSKGPGGFRPLKPDIVAPGSSVRSSIGSGDSAYAVFSGTSMAAPHASGTLALLLSAKPNTGLVSLANALRLGTETDLGAPPGPQTCEGRPYDQYPNEIYGWGRLDALSSILELTQ